MKFNLAIPAAALIAAALAAPAMADVPVYSPVGTLNASPAYNFVAPGRGELVVYYLGGFTVGYRSALFASIDGGAWVGPAQLSNSNSEGSAFSFGSVGAGDSIAFKLRVFAPTAVAGNEIFSDPALNQAGQNLIFSDSWGGGAFTYQQWRFGPTANGSIPTGDYTFVAFEDIVSPVADQFPNPQDYDYNDYRFAFKVNVVPEPATWAMLITGFGLVGFAMRRRKTAITSVAA